jgi:hypothetical protein
VNPPNPAIRDYSNGPSNPGKPPGSAFFTADYIGPHRRTGRDSVGCGQGNGAAASRAVVDDRRNRDNEFCYVSWDVIRPCRLIFRLARHLPLVSRASPQIASFVSLSHAFSLATQRMPPYILQCSKRMAFGPFLLLPFLDVSSLNLSRGSPRLYIWLKSAVFSYILLS